MHGCNERARKKRSSCIFLSPFPCSCIHFNSILKPLLCHVLNTLGNFCFSQLLNNITKKKKKSENAPLPPWLGAIKIRRCGEGHPAALRFVLPARPSPFPPFFFFTDWFSFTSRTVCSYFFHSPVPSTFFFFFFFFFASVLYLLIMCTHACFLATAYQCQNCTGAFPICFIWHLLVSPPRASERSLVCTQRQY